MPALRRRLNVQRTFQRARRRRLGVESAHRAARHHVRTEYAAGAPRFQNAPPTTSPAKFGDSAGDTRVRFAETRRGRAALSTDGSVTKYQINPPAPIASPAIVTPTATCWRWRASLPGVGSTPWQTRLGHWSSKSLRSEAAPR